MQVLVVGAGVVGLAVARAAALTGHEVVVAEAATRSARACPRATAKSFTPASTIRPASLRAVHCPRARRLLYAFCASHDVPHRKCGKLVIATP